MALPSRTNQRAILHFEGVKSAFYVWMNGKKVRYSQNPMSPAEFDVTDLIPEGENRLAVVYIGGATAVIWKIRIYGG